MNFTIYEVISHLVPGYIIIFVLRSQLGIEIKDMGSFGVIALAYGVGFIVQTLASWIEGLLYITWGGKPSNQLINGKDMWKVRFFSAVKAKQLLEEDARVNNLTNASNDMLFEIAQRKVNARKYERVINFNASYAFARAMTLAFISSLLFSVIYQPGNIGIIILLGILSIVSWYRAKQRGFYFAREVLNMYLIEKVES